MELKPLALLFAFGLAASASAEGIGLFDLLPEEKPAPKRELMPFEKGYVSKPSRVVTNTVEKVVEKPVEVEKIVEPVVERPVTSTVEKVVEKVVEKPVEVEKIVERVVEKPVEVEKVVERHVTNTVEKVVEKPVFVDRPVTSVVERVVERVVTNTVEKLVRDRGAEAQLKVEKARLADRGDLLEARNTELAETNEELRRQLEAEREKVEKLKRVAPKGAAEQLTGRPARITSATTFYDRKEGVVLFNGRVWVDDERYQLHADKAYVFMNGTNEVRHIVAIGNVAMTNETRRAYGAKVSYYRDGGMVVLYSGDGITAEVRDESKVEDQSVRGEKIKFWIDSEQVEVFGAKISAPTTGVNADDLRRQIGR